MTEAINFSKVYRIEPIPSKDQKELAEKGISTYPGTKRAVMATWNDLAKKYEGTGFDEFAADVMRLPAGKREEVQKRIIEKREELEAKIGIPGYLKPTSDAWIGELCTNWIEIGQDLKVRVNGGTNELRPGENHKDAILLSLIMNNPKFPKSKSDLGKSEYREARFYLTTDEELSTLTKDKLDKKMKAYVQLSELFDKGKNFQRAWEISYKLGWVDKQKVDADTLKLKMHDNIFMDPTGKALEDFLDTCAMDKEVLLVHNLFRQSHKLGVIRVAPDGTFTRGGTSYRKSITESVEFLMAPGNEMELAELKAEVEARKKKHNAIG